MTIKDTLAKLDGLYSKTKTDWVLSLSLILTEPVCPTVAIYPEGSNTTRYTTTRDTIEEGIEAAVDLVYRDVILGERIEPEYPLTNSDDHEDSAEELVEEEERLYFKRRFGEMLGLFWRMHRKASDAFPEYRWEPPSIEVIFDRMLALAKTAVPPASAGDEQGS